MNWGRSIALVMIAFAAMMAYFMVRAAQNPEPLITEHYYEQELQYQHRIDATSRANALGLVRFSAGQAGLVITFPEKVRGHAISGDLQLVRTDDPSGDRGIAISCGPSGTVLAPLSAMRAGQYIAQLTWHADSVDYFTEQKVILP